MEAPHDPAAQPGQRGHLSAGYNSTRPYGKREGLADRLDAAAERAAKDRIMPWLGLGLYEDLKAAASALRGEAERPIAPPTLSTLEYDL